MDYISGGELASVFQKHRMKLDIDYIILYASEILIALDFLHDVSIFSIYLKL